MTILITGGAGFIGSNFVLDWLSHHDEPLVNLDLLTYAGNLQNLNAIRSDNRHVFVRGDICDRSLVSGLLRQYRPRALLHFAAESHVDRSIQVPGSFIQTNVVGTYELLEATRQHWQQLESAEQSRFRFLHISTDEVYGSLTDGEEAFRESRAYQPNSPYSASKAASDHLVRAWAHTFGLPALTTNCSNNFGPYQFPEKLIPLMIVNALQGKPLPVYGDGKQIRDWLYVNDHCSALRTVLDKGAPGETYNIGGSSELRNLDVVQRICAALDELRPRSDGLSYATQIRFVEDRPGHDRRYAVDVSKIQSELGWRAAHSFESAIHLTIAWYLENEAWVQSVNSGAYRSWIESQYGQGKIGDPG